MKLNRLYRAILALCLFPALSEGAPGEPLVVYRDELAAGWENWSWGTNADFANPSPRHGSSGRSLAVTYQSAWAGLYLHSGTNITTADYTKLRFWIHGGTAGGQRLRVIPYDAALAEGTAVPVDPPAANTWTQVEITVSQFGVAELSGLVWQDTRGAAQPVFYLDDIELIAADTPPPTGVGPALSVDASANRRSISPLIYGMNFADRALAMELRLPVNRWGGNATTRYNWRNDTSNRASDWFFENIPNDNANPGALPSGSSSDKFVNQNLATGTQTIMTVPLIGWTPKSRAFACGYRVSKYGAQQSTDPWQPDCGNGVSASGSEITTNDPADTSTAIGPPFVSDWIAHLKGRYGAADGGGVRFYNLDNEPMLWNSTHRDVHPTPTSYDELRDRTIQYAAAIKAADPGAQTLGPVLWGWTAYFYSAADAVGGGDWWNRRPDRKAHGDRPFVEWYLQQMRAYEQANGQRILDYLDLHYYSQSGVALTGAGDSALQAKRLRSTRSLWDPAYTDESWIAEPVRLIPRMRDWVNTYYPGTKLAMTEYNFGAHAHINGAVALADVLGIFGREGLDLATLWDPPGATEPAAHAFRMYLNYDGAGAKFGETSVKAASADPSKVSVYAAERSDGRLTVMLVNKTTGALTCRLSLAGIVPHGGAATYRYSAASLAKIARETDVNFTDGAADVPLPAMSISLVVVAPRPAVAADFDHDLDVDADDLGHFRSCLTGSAAGPPTAGCADADLDGDGDVDQDDYGRFQRCISGVAVPADPACAG